MKTRRCGKGAGKNKRTMKKNRKTRLIKKTHKYKKTKFNRKHRKTVKIGGKNDSGYKLTNSEFENPLNIKNYFVQQEKEKRESEMDRGIYTGPNDMPAYEKVSGRTNNNKLYNVNGSPIKEENPYADEPTSVLENETLTNIRSKISVLKEELKELLAKKGKKIDIRIRQIEKILELNDRRENEEIAKIKKEEEMKEFAKIFGKKTSSHKEEVVKGRVLPNSERRSSNKKDFTIRDEFLLLDLTEEEKEKMRDEIKNDKKNGIYINNEIINALFDPVAAAEIINERRSN